MGDDFLLRVGTANGSCRIYPILDFVEGVCKLEDPKGGFHLSIWSGSGAGSPTNVSLGRGVHNLKVVGEAMA